MEELSRLGEDRSDSLQNIAACFVVNLPEMNLEEAILRRQWYPLSTAS